MPIPTIDIEKFKKIKLQFDASTTYETEERSKGKEDLQFVDGENQWDANVKENRGDRPCLVLNRIANHVDRVAGEQRMNKMNIKVIPVDDIADPATAKVKEGLIRHIEYDSTVQRVYPMGYESMLMGGRGAWRLNKEYVNNESWDQKLKIELIENPYSVYIDNINRLDPDWLFVANNISDEEYDRKYKSKEKGEFLEVAEGDIGQWMQDNKKRVAEYFWKETTSQGFLYLVKTKEGMKTIRDLPKNKNYEKKREIFSTEIWHIVISGHDVLEAPIKWDGDSIPIIMVWGKELNINGKRKVRGMVRHVKDSQRAYNYERSAWVETVALAPREHWLVTKAMVNNHDVYWSDAQKGIRVKYLMYDIDPQASDGGRPVRISPSAIPSGLERSAAFSAQEIKDIDGVHDSYLGETSNETSGVAIEKRTLQAGISNYVYTDNYMFSIQETGKKILNLQPKTYDTARMIRIMGLDEAENVVKINQQGGFDLVKGQYDCRVRAGPAFATQRLEAVAEINKFYQVAPDAAPLTWDIWARNLSWHGSDEFADRLKKAVPINIRGADEGEETQEQELSQELQQQMAEAQKIVEEAKMEQAKSKIEQAKAKVEQEEAAIDIERIKVEADKVESQVKVFKAEAKVVQSSKNNGGNE